VKFEEGGNVSVQFKVQSTSAFQFTTSISVVKRQTFLLAQQLTMDSHKTHQHKLYLQG
jgi:hypothetical protein